MNRWVIGALGMFPSMIAGVVGSLLVASWADGLPDPVATHWGGDGADGFTSVGVVIALPAVVGILGAVLGVLSVLVRDRGAVRLTLGIVVGVAVSTIAIIVGSTEMQRGLADAGDAATPTWQLLVGWLVGLAAGVGTAALVPKWTTAEQPADVGERPDVALAPGERALWTRVVTTSRVATSIIAIALMILISVALLVRSWPVIVIAVVVLVVSVAMWSVRVTVDRRGVAVRGRLGWPRTVIPMGEIDHAEYVRVRAVRDFGGFGYRVAMHGDLKGAKGFVLRSGDALLMVRRGGARDVVVVDDARTAAGLINRFVYPAGRGEWR
ncbi:hypothetical protein GIY30_06100 [Gordonia sp. HNM0687]|uniref:DUF1648 domain-containing protein n=1 Tax=Gordonia mangrovi TaxID=2665643 RepID=A0A6L7GQV9_9ACTN|nr:DUF1648 domain-containing protein [Gordonia mangrovi]MXP20928.1 hypothetical protein [Gordonia mangrovi]UVF78522.1 hypothetical protein NWF22_01130 [Gordonia mangrovi]